MPGERLSQSDCQTSFGLNLLSTLEPPRTSHVFSPLSISLGLALVHAGARGATKEQLGRVLLGDVEETDLEEHFGKVIREVKRRGDVETSIANRVFANKSYPINGSYLQKVQTAYQASAETLNFSEAEEAAQKINTFVEHSTSGKINKLVSPDSLKDAFALLVNAVYFKADWLDKFEKNSTLDRDFYEADGKARQIPFLNELETHRDYTENDTFQVLSLPYTDPDFTFVIFLPKRKFGLDAALKSLDASTFNNLLSDLTNSYLNVHIPKLRIETEISLRESLEKVGITEMFAESADLSEIASGGLRISSVVHKSIIEVDEDGTTAAASTALKVKLEMMIMAEPTEFNADHPFFFGVLFRNQPIFLGTHY
uniref:SERPIN domain-containing protein n=1 Tax=Caenorhabditis japonica TaxID=281687 RepID=A0A8R1IE87_CAEJA